jgi:hypothetical protein
MLGFLSNTWEVLLYLAYKCEAFFANKYFSQQMFTIPQPTILKHNLANKCEALPRQQM